VGTTVLEKPAIFLSTLKKKGICFLYDSGNPLQEHLAC